MTAQELLAVIRKAVADTASAGAGVVSVVNLDRYLAGLEATLATTPPPTTPEMMNAHIALHRSFVDQGLEMFRSVIGAGQDARRSSLWINGGAAVALLALIGHIVASKCEQGWMVANLTLPLGLYVVAVLLAAMASGSTYAAQAYWTDAQRQADPQEAMRNYGAGKRWNQVSIGLILSTYVLFLVATYIGAAALRSFGMAASK